MIPAMIVGMIVFVAPQGMFRTNKVLSPPLQDWPQVEAPGLCGVYSLFAVSSALGNKTELDSWVKPEYFSESWGSSTFDLVRAAEDHGLHATPLSSMTASDIGRLRSPGLLHIRARGALDVFSHWVAFLGTTPNGEFRILDPETGPDLIDVSELSARFDGNAIVITSGESDMNTAMYRVRIGWLTRIVAGGLSFMMGVLFVSWLGKTASTRVLIFVFASVLTAIAITYHQFGSGLFSDRVGLASRLALYSTMTFDEVSSDYVRQIVSGETDGILIDARLKTDYVAGTIPGAIGMPLQISLSDERQLVKQISTASEVIVFCQSASCSWAEIVARRLAASGVGNIRVFREGFEGWKKIKASEKK